MPDAPSAAPDRSALAIGITGGIAPVLAAGILVARRRRRTLARRARHRGERLTLPSSADEQLEIALASKSDESAVAGLDGALHRLSNWSVSTGESLPVLFAVRLDPNHATVYLAESAALPSPFEAMHDNTAWRIDLSQTVEHVHPLAARPYPALVTIGTDKSDGVLLLNLGQHSWITISDHDGTSRHQMAAAIASELAVSPWSVETRITIVGGAVRVGAFVEPHRVAEAATLAELLRPLRGDLDARRTALTQRNEPSPHLRGARGGDVEDCVPHIFVLTTEQPQADVHALEDLVRRSAGLGLIVLDTSSPEAAASTVTRIEIASADEATLHVRDELQPLTFRPQLLTAPDIPDTPVDDPSPARLADTGLARSEAPTTTDGQLHPLLATSELIAPEHEGSDDAPATESPLVTDPTDLAVGPAADVAWEAPYVRLLGPIDVLRHESGVPMPGRGAEFLAYLLLHSGTITGAKIQSALWPYTWDRANNNTRTLARQVRAALGYDPDGRPLLPEGSKAAGFTLHPAIRCDWKEFRALVGDEPADATTEHLTAALRLVHGQPLGGARAHRGWWSWLGTLEDAILAAILEAADELASRALAAGDTTLARLAARAAQAADPVNEAGWRIELRTALRDRNRREFDQTIDDIFHTVGAADPNYALDSATQAIIDQADWSAGRSS